MSAVSKARAGMAAEPFSGFEEFAATEKVMHRYRLHAFLHDRNQQLFFIQLTHTVNMKNADIDHLIVAAQRIVSVAESKFYANSGSADQYDLMATARKFFSASGFELFASDELTAMARKIESSVH